MRPWTLIEGEALPALHAMADESIDAVITDPPYSSDGVLVHLQCEGGCGPFVLQIAQHKGETLMQIGEVKRVIQWGGE